VEEQRLVDRLIGSPEEKARLLLFLQILSRRRTIVNAAQELGVSERRFYQLRDQLLQAALDSLTPRTMGRRSRAASESSQRIAALEAQVRDLRLDLRAAQIREEIALAMPHLARRRPANKKGARQRARKRSPPARNAGSSGCVSSPRHVAPTVDVAASPASVVCENWNGPSVPTLSPSVAGRQTSD
jgi:hypothetical protein